MSVNCMHMPILVDRARFTVRVLRATKVHMDPDRGEANSCVNILF